MQRTQDLLLARRGICGGDVARTRGAGVDGVGIEEALPRGMYEQVLRRVRVGSMRGPVEMAITAETHVVRDGLRCGQGLTAARGVVVGVFEGKNKRVVAACAFHGCSHDVKSA